MRAGRLIAACVAVVVVAAVPALARVQKRPAVVVRGKGFSVSAWDRRGRSRAVCFRLRASNVKVARCTTLASAQKRLSYATFQDARRSFSFLGGVTRPKVVSVVATFANGDRVAFNTVRGKRYRGRRRGKVRFWGGRHAGSSRLTSLVARTGGGGVVDPTPVPPVPPPNPCGCKPPISRIVCPLPCQ